MKEFFLKSLAGIVYRAGSLTPPQGGLLSAKLRLDSPAKRMRLFDFL
jgi:hypothetical protein